MFKEIISLFSRLHLKPPDTRVYLACLHHKEGLFVHEIVRETGIHRSTVDVILARLIAADFIQRSKVGQRYKFFAQQPEAILFRQEEIAEDLRRVMPMLSRLGREDAKTDIRFFEGREGLRQVYDDILMRLKFSTGDSRELLSFASGINTLKLFPDMQRSFIDKRVRMGVRYRAVVPRSSGKAAEYRSDEKQLRLIKNVDDQKFPFKTTFEIYADSVMIYSPIRPFGGVIIRNSHIADSMRSLFRLVWDLLPD